MAADADDRLAEYRLSRDDATALAGLVVLPHDARIEILTAYLARNGPEALVDFFSQAIGLANSVVANNREAIEMFLICEADEHPYQAEKINLPTLFGAAQGVKIAEGLDQSGLCHGCAYRVGTPANQSPVTTCDARWCDESYADDFLCHERLDGDGHPHLKCAGFVQARQRNSSGPVTT